jgi:transcriptional regulator GlxA family with amidase domain
MQQFADTILPLSHYITWHLELREALQSASTTTDRIAVIEHFICQNLKPVPIYLEVIAKAAELLRTCNERASITELCKELGMSERTFQRYFKQYIGVSPKAFAQVARFNSVTKLIEQTANPSWLEILDATGYFDAAHFANDFKRITGKTPSDYYKGKTHYEKFFNAQ